MARSPLAGSVIRWPVSTEIKAPNTTTPVARMRSVVWAAPRRREPVTKSARPATSGSITAASSAGSYWPSASKVAMNRAPWARASR